MRQKLAVIIFIGIFMISGCSTLDTDFTTAPTETPTTVSPTISADEISDSEAKERAIQAEEERIMHILDENEAYTDTTVDRVYNTTVHNRTDDSVVVEVRIKYGYQYNCSGSGGYIDGISESLYNITKKSIDNIETEKDISNLCE